MSREDDNVLLDAQDDDWAWRRRIRSNRTTHLTYRLIVFLLGLVVVVGGLILVPLPGPGWLIVFLGLAIWASEFDFAQRVLEFARDKVRAWNTWIKAQSLIVQALAALLTAATVLGVLYLMFRISGVPGFIPDPVEAWLQTTLGL